MAMIIIMYLWIKKMQSLHYRILVHCCQTTHSAKQTWPPAAQNTYYDSPNVAYSPVTDDENDMEITSDSGLKCKDQIRFSISMIPTNACQTIDSPNHVKSTVVLYTYNWGPGLSYQLDSPNSTYTLLTEDTIGMEAAPGNAQSKNWSKNENSVILLDDCQTAQIADQMQLTAAQNVYNDQHISCQDKSQNVTHVHMTED